MSKYEFLQPKFNEGVLAKSLQGGSSEEFYHYGYKSSKNLIPVLSGPVVKRPGTNYIGEAKDPTAVFVPFFKDKDNTYILELGVSSGSGYLRVWSQDQLLKERTGSPGTTHATNIYETASTVPWTSAQLETVKFTQSGDIIFVCCPDKKPHRIFRTLVTSGTRAADDSFWTVDEFVMTDGPYKSINIWSEDDATKRYSDDFIMWLDPDIVFSDLTFTVIMNTINHMKSDLWLITPQIVKNGDPAWDVITNQDFINEQYGFHKTFPKMQLFICYFFSKIT